MADVIPCLLQLRSEFNAVAPSRDKASDGGIGDAAHQGTQSDHNDDEIGNVPIHDADKIHEVHAIDVDVDLRQAGLSMERIVQFLLARCRSGAENRLRYIIFNRRIWQAKNGWIQETYRGANPHDHHAHFSGSYTTSLEASTASWHLEDLTDMALDTADKTWLGSALANRTDPILAKVNELEAKLAALPQEVWDKPRLTNPYNDTPQSPGTLLRYAPSRSPHDVTQTAIAALAATLNTFIAGEITDDNARALALQGIQDTIASVAPAVAAQVIAALPDGSDPISQEEVTTAVRAAFRDAFSAA